MNNDFPGLHQQMSEAVASWTATTSNPINHAAPHVDIANAHADLVRRFAPWLALCGFAAVFALAIAEISWTLQAKALKELSVFAFLLALIITGIVGWGYFTARELLDDQRYHLHEDLELRRKIIDDKIKMIKDEHAAALALQYAPRLELKPPLQVRDARGRIYELSTESSVPMQPVVDELALPVKSGWRPTIEDLVYFVEKSFEHDAAPNKKINERGQSKAHWIGHQVPSMFGSSHYLVWESYKVLTDTLVAMNILAARKERDAGGWTSAESAALIQHIKKVAQSIGISQVTSETSKNLV